MTKNALAKIIEAKGNIVIIASCLGLVLELTSPLYCTTKTGLIMLTKCLAQQYADAGRGKSELCAAGPIDTPLLQRSFPDKESETLCAVNIPMERIGRLEDINHMVAFLVSDDASYITGGEFPVGGGISSTSTYSKGRISREYENISELAMIGGDS